MLNNLSTMFHGTGANFLNEGDVIEPKSGAAFATVEKTPQRYSVSLNSLLMKFTGVVGDGFGGAKGDVARGCYTSLSPNLHPGTLNIYTPDSPWKLPLPPKQLIDHDNARCLIWDATLYMPNGSFLKVWAMWPQHRKVFTWNVIEVLSEVPLRKTYGLTNGAEVEVEICPTIPIQ